MKSGQRRLIPCLVPPATCWLRGHLPKGITEQGEEGAIPGPLHSSGKGPAGCSRGHGGGGIGSCLRLPTPNPFATFRLPEAIGSGRRKGVPRAGAGASEAQPKVGGRGCAEPKLRRLQTLSIPHRSRLPPAQRWTHARRAAGPRRLRAGGDRESRSGDGLPPASPLWQLPSWLWKPGSQRTAHPWRRQSRCPAPGASSTAAVPGEESETQPDPGVSLWELGTWDSRRDSGAGSGRCRGDGDREVEGVGRGGSATGWSCPGRL